MISMSTSLFPDFFWWSSCALLLLMRMLLLLMKCLDDYGLILQKIFVLPMCDFFFFLG